MYIAAGVPLKLRQVDMDFLKENAILKLNLDVLVLQKGATKSR